MAGVASWPVEVNLSNNRLSAVLSDKNMASDVSGMASYTNKERELVKLQAEVTLQEEVTRLAQKRLAIEVLGAEMQSTSNRSVRSCDMRIPGILSPPMKVHKAGNGGEDHPMTALTRTILVKRTTRAHPPSISLVHPHLQLRQ